MGKRIPFKSADEYDLLTKARKYHGGRFKKYMLPFTKRSYRRRERRIYNEEMMKELEYENNL